MSIVSEAAYTRDLMAKKNPSSGKKRPREPSGRVGPAPERQRVAEELLCSGVRYGDVCAAIVAQFGVSTRQSEVDIKRARAAIGDAAEADRPYLKHMHRERLRRIAGKVEGDSDWGNLWRYLDQLAKLDGLYEAERISADVKTSGVLVIPRKTASE